MVFAAKPELALPGHKNRTGRLNRIASSIPGGDDKLDLARLAQFGFARQQAARVTLAAAHRAQVFGAGLVIKGVEAAHHALAAGGDDAGHGFHLQRHARGRLAAQVERQHLEPDLLVARHPAFGLDACHHARRPHGGHAAQGLYLAIRVGKGGFEQQLLRLFAGRYLANVEFADTVAIQRQRHFVGNDPLVLCGGAFLLVLRGAAALGARWEEAEVVVVAKVQGLAAHQGRHAHRQIRRATACHVADLHVGGHRFHIDQRLFVSRADVSLQHRQTEFFHPKLPAGHDALLVTIAGRALALKLHLVHAKLGGQWNGKAVLGALAAGGGLAPGQRQSELLAAADVSDQQLGGRQGGQLEALASLAARQVLHRHRFAGAQQRAVKNGVDAFVGLRALAGGHVEAPGLDALVPVAPGKSQVFDAAQGVACAHKIRLPTVLARAARRVA